MAHIRPVRPRGQVPALVRVYYSSKLSGCQAPPSSAPDFPHIGPLTVIIISRLSNSNLRFCVSSRLLYSGLEDLFKLVGATSHTAGRRVDALGGGSALVVFQHLAHVVHAMRLSPSAHCLLKGFPHLILIGRQPNNRFQVTEPCVQERLVVGDPMPNTRGWSCFSQLITGGVSRRQGNGRNRKRSRSQRV
jgi:hypothetical protein